MTVPILLIVGVVATRFVLDLFVTSTIAQGPYRMFLITGCFYLLYFVMTQKMKGTVMEDLLWDFVLVSSVVSTIAILSVIGSSWPILKTLRTYQEYGFEVGSFARLHTTYHHFSVLAVMICIVLIVTSAVKAWKKWLLGGFALLNFWNVVTAGYRANLYILLVGLALFGFYLLFQGKTKRTVLVAFLLLPMFIYGSEYVAERNLQTTDDDGSDSSIMYRFVEIGYGLEKLAEVNGWMFGVGYADGFIYTLAPVGEQETFFLHNGYASLFYNYGIAGSLAWLTLIIGVIVYILRHARRMRKDLCFVIFGLYLLGQLVVNFSSGIFNREISATFCFLFAFSVLETMVGTSKRMLNTL